MNSRIMTKIFISNALMKRFAIRLANICTSTTLLKDHYKLVVVGGGAGGASTVNVFGPKLGKQNVAVIEPNDTHYYQPMWTLVGAGLKNFDQSSKPMANYLNKNSTWIKDKAVQFNPDKNLVITGGGKEIEYDYLVVAMGIQLRFDLIKGLPEAFSTPGVSSNYHKDYVGKTLTSLKNFKNGNAIFTFPNTPIKCAGAPQKIMYLSDDYFRRNSKRDKANIMYNTALGVIFAVKKYAEVLTEICKKRNLAVNCRHTLVEIKSSTKEAVFNVNDADNKFLKTETFPYEMIHVGAPCSAPEVLRNSTLLKDQNGYLNLNKDTLQHVKYKNVFGIGDCTSLPTAKTAAAVAAEIGVLRKNLQAVMDNKELKATYDGYTSCPLVTSFNSCILAEFDYNVQALETFPFNQAKEMKTMFFLKKEFMPQLYWHGLLKGYWYGPKAFRRMFRFQKFWD